MHVAILQKMYKNKVSDDLESESLLFPAIISQQLDHIKSSSCTESVESHLTHRVNEIDAQIGGNVIAQPRNGVFNFLNQSNSNAPHTNITGSTFRENPFSHLTEPPLKYQKKTCTYQHEQFDGNHILPNGHAINCLHAGDTNGCFQKPNLEHVGSSKQTPPIQAYLSNSASYQTPHQFHKYPVCGDICHLYPYEQFPLSEVGTPFSAPGHQMHLTETCHPISQGIFHETLSKNKSNVKFPHITSPKKCYYMGNEPFNTTHLSKNCSSNENGNCQQSNFPKLKNFGKHIQSQSNTELSLNGNKCVATTSTSTSSTSTSMSFANFHWHKPSPSIEENGNCTFISSTSTNTEDNSTNRIQQTDVLDLSVLKTEKVDDPEYYEDSNTYNPALFDQSNKMEFYTYKYHTC